MELKKELTRLSAAEQSEIATFLSQLRRKADADYQAPLNLPGKLYKYRRINVNTIQAIVCSAVYFPEPAKLNDPFDCKLCPTNHAGTEKEYREFFTKVAKRTLSPDKVTDVVNQMIRSGVHRNPQKMNQCWEDTQKEENKKRGVFCLSADPANVLMWSHYTDDHKGCCLEFSTAESFFKTARIVKYPQEYPKHRLLDYVNNHELLYKLTLFTKANLWEYEQEWRVLDSGKSVKGSGLYKFEKEALTGIIFGCQMIPEHKDLVRRLVAERNPPVHLYEAKPCDGEFKMDIVPIAPP